MQYLHCLLCLWRPVYPCLVAVNRRTTFCAVQRLTWTSFHWLLRKCCRQETTELTFVAGCCFVSCYWKHCLATLQKQRQNIYYNLYCWLQCLKQADIEQGCLSVWETIWDIHHFRKAEQNVMEAFGGIVVETRNTLHSDTVTGLQQEQQDPHMPQGEGYNPYNTAHRGWRV